MALVVKPLNHNFKIEIKHEKEKIIFTFNQLDYRTKSLISSLITSVKSGQYSMDATMQIFYNLKYGLRKVEGLVSPEGKYELSFEDDKKTILTDVCVDELLATVISDNLQYAARELSRAVLPSEIVHPLTLRKLEGVKVVVDENGVKKKSLKASK